MKFKGKPLPVLAAVAGLALIGLMAAPADAGVEGVCSNCHTMHNSQDNDIMTSNPAESTPNAQLLITDCVGCHSGTESPTNTDYGAPVVIHTNAGGPTYQAGASQADGTLAGGDFYWVADAGGNSDATGHNVVGVSGSDATLTAKVPGLDTTTPSTVGLDSQLNCYGSKVSGVDYGCHLTGGHHTNNNRINDVANAYLDGTGSTGNMFRFLSGVIGYEDTDWEWSASDSDHNNYKGVVADVNDGGATRTISALCADCHGLFHGDSTDNASSEWIRHPTDGTDFSGYAGTEFASYDTYRPNVPVAWVSPNALPSTLVDPTTDGGGSAVACISCHRAHGSPNDDLLRWSYSSMDANTGTGSESNGIGSGQGFGCFVCHTQKDGA